MLQRVDAFVFRDDSGRRIDVASDEGLNRFGHLCLRESAHLRDGVVEEVQLLVEGLDDVFRRHGWILRSPPRRYPIRPVM